MSDIETVNPPDSSARFLANPKARYILFGIFGFIIIMLIWRIVAPPGANQNIKTKAETDIEKIIDNSKKSGLDDKGKTTTPQAKAAEQPVGDPEAIAVLNTVDARNEAAAKRKAIADAQALDQLAYQNYSRKMQGLSYDEQMAAAWEAKMAAAAAEGKSLSAPVDIAPENLEELKRSNPTLYAKWVAMRGGDTRPGTNQQQPQVAAQGKGGAPGANAAQAHLSALQKGGSGPGGIPAGIDPKTGLPTGGAGGAVGPLNPSDVIFALADDGTPDIARGAIPVTVQYIPPGSNQPVTITKWIRPGYLTNRVRPVDPRLAQEEDEAYRRSMKDTTDVPADSAANVVSIPYRYTNARVRVAPANDFQAQNKYVVVLPNPYGQLTPPNPPKPRQAPTQPSGGTK